MYEEKKDKKLTKIDIRVTRFQLETTEEHTVVASGMRWQGVM